MPPTKPLTKIVPSAPRVSMFAELVAPPAFCALAFSDAKLVASNNTKLKILILLIYRPHTQTAICYLGVGP